MKALTLLFLLVSLGTFAQRKEFFKIDDAEIKEGSINRTKLDNSYGDSSAEDYFKKNKSEFEVILHFFEIHPNLQVEIGVYDNSSSKQKKNIKFSQEMAQFIVDILISKGVKEEQVVAKGYGDVDKLVPDEKLDRLPDDQRERAKQKNNRVELKALKVIEL